VGGVSNPRPLALAEPSSLGKGTEIVGAGDSVYASVANDVVGASTPTTGTILSGELLNVRDCFNEISERKILLLTL
jgi:hypothetical protein